MRYQSIQQQDKTVVKNSETAKGPDNSGKLAKQPKKGVERQAAWRRRECAVDTATSAGHAIQSLDVDLGDGSTVEVSWTIRVLFP